MPIVGQFGSLAGLGSLILPGGAFESIATVTVGSGGASSIEFTSIPGTYQHLQIRVLYRNTGIGQARVRFNSDTGNNYTEHQLSGDGSSASAYGAGNQSGMFFAAAGSTDTYMAAVIYDILDYANTSKTKTVRQVGGHDQNGSGFSQIRSGLWNSTSAITSIVLAPQTGSWVQHSTAALYGVRA